MKEKVKDLDVRQYDPDQDPSSKKTRIQIHIITGFKLATRVSNGITKSCTVNTGIRVNTGITDGV